MQRKYYYNVCHSLQNCFKLYMYYTCTHDVVVLKYNTCNTLEDSLHISTCIAVYILMWCFFYMNTILLAGVYCDKLLLDKSDKNSCVKRMFTSLY